MKFYFVEVNKFEIDRDLLMIAEAAAMKSCLDLKIPLIELRWMLPISETEFRSSMLSGKRCVETEGDWNGFYYRVNPAEVFINLQYCNKGNIINTISHECRHCWQNFYNQFDFDDNQHQEVDAVLYSIQFSRR